MALDAILWMFIKVVLVFTWQIIQICQTLLFGASFQSDALVVIILGRDQIVQLTPKIMIIIGLTMAESLILIQSISLQLYIV